MKKGRGILRDEKKGSWMHAVKGTQQREENQKKVTMSKRVGKKKGRRRKEESPALPKKSYDERSGGQNAKERGIPKKNAHSSQSI